MLYCILQVSSNPSNTVVVLSGTSHAATPSHSLGQGALPTAVTVRTAAAAATPASSKTHTILVMPVSSTQAANDGGPAAKRLKAD